MADAKQNYQDAGLNRGNNADGYGNNGNGRGYGEHGNGRGYRNYRNGRGYGNYKRGRGFGAYGNGRGSGACGSDRGRGISNNENNRNVSGRGYGRYERDRDYGNNGNRRGFGNYKNYRPHDYSGRGRGFRNGNYVYNRGYENYKNARDNEIYAKDKGNDKCENGQDYDIHAIDRGYDYKRDQDYKNYGRGRGRSCRNSRDYDIHAIDRGYNYKRDRDYKNYGRGRGRSCRNSRDYDIHAIDRDAGNYRSRRGRSDDRLENPDTDLADSDWHDNSEYERGCLERALSEVSIKERCQNELRCGHACGGFDGESTCAPCLNVSCWDYFVKQRHSDNCVICYSDTLAAAPIIMLKCKHIFHLHCIEAILANKWVGPTITFNFILCPLCKRPMKHKYLEPSLKLILDLKEDVRRKALLRLKFENLHNHKEISEPTGRFYRNPEGFALEKYCYYQCFKCKKAYFGGTRVCQDEAAGGGSPRELICGGCSNKERKQTCEAHGNDFLEYKCRYCCSLAVFFCFGDTHFCSKCHEKAHKLQNTALEKLPKCPAGPDLEQLDGECPLKVKHPPTGEEFSLGCGLCANTDTF